MFGAVAATLSVTAASPSSTTKPPAVERIAVTRAADPTSSLLPSPAIATAPPTADVTPRPNPDATEQPTPSQTTLAVQTPGPAVPVVAAPRHIQWGAYVPGFPGSTSALDTIEHSTGRHLDVVMWYVHWAGPWSSFNADDVHAVVNRGSVPMITWMSDDPSAPGYSSPSSELQYTASQIISGRYDAYIRAWAAGLRDIGRPVMLRLDHEMNGNWSAWSPGVNGQTPQDFVALWRHVHDIFTAAGATNVQWVWSPNVAYPGSTPLSGLYPGDAYVDVVGVDGYNWGPTGGAHTWQSFASVFDTTLAQVHAVTSRPMLLSEVATTDVGGDKAAWIRDFFAALALRNDVTGFVWFNVNKETDWRLDSSAAALSSFVAGLKSFA